MNLQSQHVEDWRFVFKIPEQDGTAGIIQNTDFRSMAKSYLITDLYFARDLHYIYKSTDMGLNWFKIYTNKLEWWYDGRIKKGQVTENGLIYFIFYDDRKIRKTTTHNYIYEDIKLDEIWESKGRGRYELNDFTMLNDSVGIAVGFHDYFITKDAWKTIEKKQSPFVDSLFTIFESHPFLDKGFFLYGMKYGPGISHMLFYDIQLDSLILLYDKTKSNDFVVNDSSSYIYFEPEITSDSVFYLGAKYYYNEKFNSYPTIFKSTDRGSSWKKVYEDTEPETAWGFSQVAFYDENNGVAMGTHGVAAMTNDGGKTWAEYNVNNHVRKYDAPHGLGGRFHLGWIGQTPILVTTFGTVLRYEGDFFKFDFEEIRKKGKLVSPPDKSTFAKQDIDFTWETVAGAKWFKYQIALDPEFKSIIHQDTTSDTTQSVSNLPKGARLYWRVAACNEQIEIFYDSWVCYTDMENYIPKIESPFCNSRIQRRKVLIEWEDVVGAKDYEFQLSKKDDFLDNIMNITNVGDSKILTTELEDEGKYYWRFRAYNDTITSEWSEVCNFNVETISGLYKEADKEGIKIYQTSDELVLENQNPSIFIDGISLYDIQGRIAYTININPSQTEIRIAKSEIPNGAYFIIMNSSRETLFSKVMVY